MTVLCTTIAFLRMPYLEINWLTRSDRVKIIENNFWYQTWVKNIIPMNSIHISTARKILQAPEPVSLRCWTKSGAIMELNNAIPLRYNFYEGTQQFKILASQQIRTIRLNLIFELNGTEVFL